MSPPVNNPRASRITAALAVIALLGCARSLRSYLLESPTRAQSSATARAQRDDGALEALPGECESAGVRCDTAPARLRMGVVEPGECQPAGMRCDPATTREQDAGCRWPRASVAALCEDASAVTAAPDGAGR